MWRFQEIYFFYSMLCFCDKLYTVVFHHYYLCALLTTVYVELQRLLLNLCILIFRLLCNTENNQIIETN